MSRENDGSPRQRAGKAATRAPKHQALAGVLPFSARARPESRPGSDLSRPAPESGIQLGKRLTSPRAAVVDQIAMLPGVVRKVVELVLAGTAVPHELPSWSPPHALVRLFLVQLGVFPVEGWPPRNLPIFLQRQDHDIICRHGRPVLERLVAGRTFKGRI